MSHQAVNDDMPRQLALHHKPRGLTFQIIISIDDDNSMLYANYGSSAIICYKHNSEPLDLEKLPANNGVFDYTFFSQNSLEASLDSFIERVNNASGQFLFQYHPNLLSTEKSTFVDAQLEHDSTSLEAILSALWNKTNENNFRAKISFPFNSGYVAGHYWSNGPSASTTRREVDQFVQNLSPATYQRRSFPGPSGSDVSNGSKRMSIVFDLGRVIMEVSA